MDSGRVEVPAGTVNLDTVRALHQTVVSLRTALEVSKNELKQLKEKYQKHSDCIEYADVIEKLTIENHILRRKIIDTDLERTPSSQNIHLQVTYSPRRDLDNLSSEVRIQTATTEGRSPNATRTDEFGNEQQFEDENRSVGEEIEVHDQILSSDQYSDKFEQIEEGHEFCSTSDSLKPLRKQSLERYSSENSEKNSLQNSPEYDQENSPEQISNELSPQNNDQSSDLEITNFQLPDDNGTFKAKLELLSKFDVKIKVRALKEGALLSSTTSDSESVYGDKREKEFEKDNKTNRKEQSSFGDHKKVNKQFDENKNLGDNKNFEDKKEHIPEKVPKDTTFEKEKESNILFKERREHFENLEDKRGNKIHLKAISSDNIKMAVSNEGDAKSKKDNFDIQVRITSEESLVVKETMDRSRRKDTLNLDVDNLSLRSMSEGDNSVFSEQAATPLEHPDRSEQSDESEVDDIELIFTTDESKDISNLQEDLVSIRDTEWTPHSTTAQSTPVLVKFHTLDPDFQPGSEDQAQGPSKPMPEFKKRVSLPGDKDITKNVFFNTRSLDLPGRGILKSYDNKSDNMLYGKSPNTSTRRLDSVDSLSCEFNRGISFDNTKSSSFELGSSTDMMNRDESTDSFQRMSRLGHRFSVFAENDLTKCGISEEDLAANVYVRRNTCPNPFQYRAGPLRAVPRGPGPLKVPSGRLRPILRDGTTPRRDCGAQTDVCALPNRWGSDGHLAYKMHSGGQALQSLRPRHVPARRPSAPRAPQPAAGDGRRLLLSDIGFTSMVPELSRSAEPLCALARRTPAPATYGSEADSLLTHTSRFVSRSSSHHSPGFSSDWTPTLYLPGAKAEYAWRTSLPDVSRQCPDTARLMHEADTFIRRSVDNLRYCDVEVSPLPAGVPYIPREPKQLRLGHAVKVITPAGRVAVGRVRYVGIAGGTAANSAVVVGAEFPHPTHLPLNDGTHNGRRYFLATPQCTALFVPFHKVVMAWAN